VVFGNHGGGREYFLASGKSGMNCRTLSNSVMDLPELAGIEKRKGLIPVVIECASLSLHAGLVDEFQGRVDGNKEVETLTLARQWRFRLPALDR